MFPQEGTPHLGKAHFNRRFIYLFFFFETGYLYTDLTVLCHYVDRTDVEFTRICPLLPPEF